MTDLLRPVVVLAVVALLVEIVLPLMLAADGAAS